MTRRIIEIEYIRSLAMLGVIGIHTGAWSLSNPDTNIHLFALFEIVSRFSVPIFFFVSAFGIFYLHHQEPASCLSAIPQKRIVSVLIPYLFWSLLYMLNYTLQYNDLSIWQISKLWEYLLFGLASYHLYFMVILLLFLLCLPLLRSLAIWLSERPLPRLGGLLALQIFFNAYSSYFLQPVISPYWLKLLIGYRLNYLPLHYLWIFMLGAVFALHYPQWQNTLKKHHTLFKNCFLLSLGIMLTSYYFAVLKLDFSLKQTAYTIHQLSPMGVLYTGAAALYLSLALAKPLHPVATKILNILSRHSFFIYLVHPFVMSGLDAVFVSYQVALTVPAILLFFFSTVVISLTVSYLIQLLSQQLPAAAWLLTGKALPPPRIKNAAC